MIPDAPGRAERILLLAFVSAVVLFNAVTLLPELTVVAPNVNDDAEHLLFTQRAAEALASGENPFDMWVPELDLGFPQFLYYQNLPHLAAVAVHRVAGLDVTTAFLFVRYLLLVLFPLTVLWSLRYMGAPFRVAALAAAVAPLLSGSFRYGFEYDSYVWRGFGMYTQLWAMHLAFVALAAFWRVFARRTDHRVAVVAFSALALSHLLYAYMTAIVVGIVFLAGLRRETLWPRLRSGLLVAGAVAVITSYMWIPFLVVPGYLNESHGSPYVMTWMYDSFGAGQILGWLATGQLFDAGRPPVLTLLLALGIVAAAVTRSRLAIVLVCVFAVGLVLYFGRPTIGALLSLLPMQRALLFHRFVGIMDIAAIPLMGFGAALLWEGAVRAAARLPAPAALRARGGLALAGVVLAACLGVAMAERAQFYAYNTLWLTQTRDAIAADADARRIIAALRELPPGRVHAGMRNNWGAEMRFGLPFKGVKLHDLFVWERLAALAPPYRGASLNSDVIWDFREDLPSDHALFNVRYVILPAARAPQAFLTPLLRTPTYVLYEAPGRGYGQYVPIASRQRVSSQASLISRNRQWFAAEARTGAAIRWDYPAADDAVVSGPAAGCSDTASPLYERVSPARLEFIVTCANSATFVIKVTYHPNWRVTVDGAQVPTFMLSPSLLGIVLPAGGHTVVAEYRSLPQKAPLLALGALMLLGIGASALPRRWWRGVRRPSLSPPAFVLAAGEREILLASAGIVAALVALGALTTAPLAANNGLGYDGAFYSATVQALRGEPHIDVPAPYGFRILPAALVALSGLDPRTGFLVLSVIATILTGPALALLLRRFGATTFATLLAVLWWAALPLTARYATFYPTLIDPIGLLLLVLLLLAALARRVVLFAVLLALAALTRENLIALAPFLWLVLREDHGDRRALARAVAATAPALVLFVLIRAFPPVPPVPNIALTQYVANHVYWFILNSEGRAVRYAAAIPLALGLLATLPLVRWRENLRFLRAHPAWLYFLAAGLVLSLIGGLDNDRYALLLSPLLLVLVFALAPHHWSEPWRAALVTGLQLVAARFLWPIGPDQATYFQSAVMTMEVGGMLALALLVLVLTVPAAVLLVWRRPALGVSLV